MVLVAGLAAGCGSSPVVTGAAGSPSLASATPPDCPAQLATGVEPWPGGWSDPKAPNDTMVPGSPTGARACRYDTPKHGRTRVLNRSAVLDATPADALGAAFNEPKAWDGTYLPCPADMGTHELVVFGYPDRAPVRVLVNTSGCQNAANGRRIVLGASAAIGLLTHYLGAPTPPFQE